MKYDEELVRQLGRRVKDGDITWADAGREYTDKTGTTTNGENIRNKYRRLEDVYEASTDKNEMKNCENETHFEDGSVEITKDFYFDREKIKTPDDILELFGYDKQGWEVVSWTFGKWEVAIKDEENNRVCTTIRAKIRPRQGNTLSNEDYIASAQEIFGKAIKAKKFMSKESIGGLSKEKLMLIPQIEAHLGKISEDIDTGFTYNSEIAIERVERVFDYAIDMQKTNNCDRCLVVVGGDFFNSESDNQTTSGTPQRNDVGFKKMFTLGLDVYTRGLLLLREFFNDVDVKIVAGNHSRAMEFMMYVALSCYFKDDPKVHFSDNYKDTQSYVFGDTSLYFNHGDANQKRLIASIPAEFYKDFGATKNRYLFLGHLHKLEQINSENGIIVHRVPAICEDDSWHYQNRFGLGNTPSHEIMVFDKSNGMISSNFVYFEDAMKKGENNVQRV